MFKFLLSTALILIVAVSNASAKPAEVAEFFTETEALLSTYVDDGKVDYQSLKSSGALAPLISTISTADLSAFSREERKAFLINAYNLLVIDQALMHYPLASVLDVANFFDNKKVTVAGQKMSLNTLEKQLLLKEFKDPRLHFVLVCGAIDCPPIIAEAYKPSLLEKQLDRQTRLAVNNPSFLKISDDAIELSQIFNWYASDFGGSKANVIGFINTYRDQPLNQAKKVGYYPYDWSLNQGGARRSTLSPESNIGTPASAGAANAARYVVSSTIPTGTVELKVFNNLYSQVASGERSSFFTTTTSALYGLTDRINVGFEGRYRRVRYDDENAASNFDVLNSSRNAGSFRQGIASVGPKIRIAPFQALPNFSIQSTYQINTFADAPGNSDGLRFFDFQGDSWFTQVFNDFSVGSRFSIFTEVDFFLEDIGSADEGRLNRFSTPLTGIVSFFPNSKTTLYSIASYSPFWQENFDYFYQFGAGAKYQFTPNFEIELLATNFNNSFLSDVGGMASTVNLGIRVNL